MNKYEITIREDQVEILCRALEMYARVGSITGAEPGWPAALRLLPLSWKRVE